MRFAPRLISLRRHYPDQVGKGLPDTGISVQKDTPNERLKRMIQPGRCQGDFKNQLKRVAVAMLIKTCYAFRNRKPLYWICSSPFT